MGRYFRLYLILFSQNLQSQMEYKLDFILGTITTILGQIVGIAFVWVIFQRIGDLNGWTLYEIMLIYGIAALPYGLFELFFNGIWGLTHYIRMGNFDRFMVRPLNPLFSILADQSAIHGLGNFFSGVIIIAKASIGLNFQWDFMSIVFVALTTFCGTIIYVSINTAAAVLSFWYIGSRNTVLFITQRVRDFSRYPLDIYTKPLQVFLIWIVPFAFTGFFPATFLLERNEFYPYVYITPIVTAVCFSLTYIFWRIGMNRYQSTGA